MTVYFTLLFVVVALAALAQKIKSKHVSALLYVLAVAFLVGVAGMRSRYIGTDAGYYVLWFENTQSLSDVFLTKLEPGYFFLCWLAHFISDNYASIFTLVAVVIVASFGAIIHKYSVNSKYSFFLFIVGGDYFVSYNGMRQGLAIAVYVLAIDSILRKKLMQYIAIVLVASLFHKTAIVALPVYFLLVRRNSLKELVVIIAAGMALVWSFEFLFPLSSLLDQRYAQYGETTETGLGLGVTALMILFCVFFVIFKRNVTRHREMYDKYLNMYLLATLIVIVTAALGMNASGLRRISLYFSISVIFLWPIVMANIRDPMLRTSVIVGFVSCYLVYFGLSLQRFGDLVPYLLNPVFF